MKRTLRFMPSMKVVIICSLAPVVSHTARERLKHKPRQFTHIYTHTQEVVLHRLAVKNKTVKL